MSTLKEIAEECGVSVSTVHYVLNDPKRISGRIREKVLEAVRQKGYLKDKNLKISTIGLVFDNFANSFTGSYYNWIILGIQKRLAKLKLRLQIFDGFDVEYIDVHHLSGILIVGRVKNEIIEKVKKFKIPYLLAGHPGEDKSLPAVYFDIESSFMELLEFVVSCRHKNIAFINGAPDKDDIIFKKQHETFVKVMEKNDIEKNLNNIFQVDYGNLQTIEIACNKILNLKQKISCIVCSNDQIAYCCYQYARKYNLKIPRDISITGFDDIYVPDYIGNIEPKLTTVYADRIKLGEAAVDLLIKDIQKPQTVKHHLLPSFFVVGNSVGRLKL